MIRHWNTFLREAIQSLPLHQSEKHSKYYEIFRNNPVITDLISIQIGEPKVAYVIVLVMVQWQNQKYYLSKYYVNKISGLVTKIVWPKSWINTHDYDIPMNNPTAKISKTVQPL